MKMYPLIEVRAGIKGKGWSSRAFWQYEKEAAIQFIAEQISICGKENVTTTMVGRNNEIIEIINY